MPDRLERKPVRLDPRLPWLADTRRFLSPMAGVTDRAFRAVCRRFGADIGFCEFVSATGLTYGGEGSWKLVDTDGETGLVGVQIFGSEPAHMAQAAHLLAPHRMDVLDINFGCPVKKVVKKCGGSALLADVPAAGAHRARGDRRQPRAGDRQDPHGLGRGLGQLPRGGAAAAGAGPALGDHARPDPGAALQGRGRLGPHRRPGRDPGHPGHRQRRRRRRRQLRRLGAATPAATG